MSDLAEIRRFWPKATWWGKNMHAAANGLRGLLWIERVKVGLHRVVHVPENWGRKDFDGPTIAAAMAAAGFARRKPGRYASYGRINAKAARSWQQGMLPDYCRCELVSRQRPRKGVRLGTRQRRAAFGKSLDDAIERVKLRRLLGLVDQLRALDRGEIGG